MRLYWFDFAKQDRRSCFGISHSILTVHVFKLICLPHGNYAEETPTQAIEEAFKKFTDRDDIAIILINQYVSLSKNRSGMNSF